jgi:hypothetical protein
VNGPQTKGGGGGGQKSESHAANAQLIKWGNVITPRTKLNTLSRRTGREAFMTPPQCFFPPNAKAKSMPGACLLPRSNTREMNFDMDSRFPRFTKIATSFRRSTYELRTSGLPAAWLAATACPVSSPRPHVLEAGARTGAVKADRRADLPAHSAVSRACLDSPEDGRHACCVGMTRPRGARRRGTRNSRRNLVSGGSQ